KVRREHLSGSRRRLPGGPTEGVPVAALAVARGSAGTAALSTLVRGSNGSCRGRQWVVSGLKGRRFWGRFLVAGLPLLIRLPGRVQRPIHCRTPYDRSRAQY